MKPKENSRSRWHVSVKPYRDDIEEIVRILTEADGRVKLSDKEFEYDSLTELEERRGQAISNLEITGIPVYVNVDVSLWKAHVYCSGGRKALASYNQILELFDK